MYDPTAGRHDIKNARQLLIFPTQLRGLAILDVALTPDPPPTRRFAEDSRIVNMIRPLIRPRKTLMPQYTDVWSTNSQGMLDSL